MELAFEKMERIKSYQHVVEQIQSAIGSGTLKEGDKLPSELKLTRMFGASRGTIREALRVLEQKGLVTIKTGVKGGPTIKEANTQPMSDSIGLLIQHQKVSLGHLAEFRELLEGHIAATAARHAAPEDIRELADLLKDASVHVDTRPSGWEVFHKMDGRFHMTLARAAQNPLIQANLKTIHDNIKVYFHQHLPFSQSLLEDNLKDLSDILAAVQKKDDTLAHTLAKEHVAKFNRLMEGPVDA